MTWLRNDREVAREVSRRMAALRKGRRRRLTGALASTGTLGFVLLACVVLLPNARQAGVGHAVQASALALAADAATGGYVLVGVACFVLGIVLTLGCIWARGRPRKEADSRPPQGTEQDKNVKGGFNP